MATIRSKLTVAYAGALIGSVAVFSVAMYAAGRSNARREAQRTVADRADQALRVLRFAASADEPLTFTNWSRLPSGERDSLAAAQITPRIANILDGVPDYVIMLDNSDRTLYFSPALRVLQSRGQNATEIERERE